MNLLSKLRSQGPQDNIQILKQFVTEQGKILPKKITALSTKEQREVTKCIKQARILGLLPFTYH
jgi:small subunit ribosomal protein S18